MPHTPAAKQALRISRQAVGLCMCGREPRLGMKQCQFCADQYARRQTQRKAQGRCGCGKFPEPGFAMCAQCRTKALERTRKKREQGLCSYCRLVPSIKGSRLCEIHKAASKRRRLDLRLEVIAAYGGCCLCCGETEEAFLCIDHVFNDGATDRKKLKIGGLYRHVKKLGFPKDRYQLLCANCNMAKQTKGVCPHQVSTCRTSLSA